jgi:MerR family transcriptional regulator, light-induced transcriptional regulator
VWEQRYNALQPDRSDGNTRYYNSQQLRRLLNIVSLLQTEQNKVSELCAMSDAQLYQLIQEQQASTTGAPQEYEYHVSQLIGAAIEFNESHFDKLFSNALLRFGLKKTYIHIIYPVLIRLGLMWSTNSLPPAQEHFTTCLFRQKLLSATDALPPPATAPGKDTWLLFLPEDEFHETGLLFANYLLRQAGKKVIYLGANVPFDSVVSAVKAIQPAHLLFFLICSNEPEQDHAFLTRLGNQFRRVNLYLSCELNRFNEANPPRHIRGLHTVQDLDALLQ